MDPWILPLLSKIYIPTLSIYNDSCVARSSIDTLESLCFNVEKKVIFFYPSSDSNVHSFLFLVAWETIFGLDDLPNATRGSGDAIAMLHYKLQEKW
jgi:hypothetical protein